MQTTSEFQGDEHKNTPTSETESTEPAVTSETILDNATPTQATGGAGWEDHKVMVIVGYVLPVLFFLLLVTDSAKDSEYARFHAGQQLNLFVALIGYYVIVNFFFTVGISMFIIALIQLIPLLLFALAVIGILTAVKGEMKELPIIGKYRLLK